MEKKKKCEWCDREFKPVHIAQKYCSRECAYEVQKAKARLKTMRGDTVRTCLFCGESFAAQEVQGWHCSPRCCNATLAYHAQLSK